MSNDRNHFYVTLFSNGSQPLYPANTLTAFTARLALPIDLGSMDRWEVGLCEFTCPPKEEGTFAGLNIVSGKVAFLYCDLISPQFVGSQYVRCLRTFVPPTTYCNDVYEYVYYVPVEKRRFQDIRIDILRQRGEPPKLKPSNVPTKVVLHFRRVAAW